MINNDIKDKLVNIFNKPLQENYVRRIVFWHDYKKEFESFIDELSIDNVKIIKIKLVIILFMILFVLAILVRIIYLI